jgi:hypothetical protein
MAQVPGEVEDGSIRTADTSTGATAAAPSTDDIRSQIEQTRAEMGDTIDAIQTRLSPSRVIADAKDSVTDATMGRLRRIADRTRNSGESVLQMVRANPLPVGLLATAAVGLVAGALHASNRRRQKATRSLTDGGDRNRRDRNSRMTSRHNNRRFLAAASAGAACWAIWRAQTATDLGDGYPKATGALDGGL